jgi:hypothetical protein
MPTITFRVNLETVNNLTHKTPYNSTESTNFKSTRVTWFPDRLLNNRRLEHGDEFTISGLNALNLKNNYTSGEFKFLDIVTETNP